VKKTFILAAGLLLIRAVASDLDSGRDAVRAAAAAASQGQGGQSATLERGGWIRLRGIAGPAEKKQVTDNRTEMQDKTGAPRAALVQLRERGHKICILVRWPADWRTAYLPLDLQKAFETGRKLGATFGDAVDAWEIENEPDLAFVPESAERYAAYLKSTYLGLKAGIADARKSESGAAFTEATTPKKRKAEGPDNLGFRSQVSGFPQAPLVLMGALGLPPGPWLGRFVANDGLSYTDGFNYHYYGYAEDFTGVYAQHERVAAELIRSGVKRYALDGIKFTEKQLPVFLTEIGYGMLGKEARDTKEGRLRQWRWFKSVGEQVNALRIEAPMAFYLPPYLELDTLEFGLTVVSRKASADAKADREGGAAFVEATAPKNLKTESWTAGGITYVPEDFQVSGFRSQVSRSEPWMEKIGAKIDGNEVTPALAQWMAIRARSRELGAGSRSWTVNVPLPSPVVIDFLNGEGLSFVKRYNGSFVMGREPVTEKPDGGSPEMAKQTKNLKPESEKPTTGSQQPTTAVRSEEFMLHMRTANGNLYEVYPTRQAATEWQHYLESEGNFTMSFYGRAGLPWRFAENKPASLVVVMYPKQLPATFEFRRAQLLRLGKNSYTEAAKAAEQTWRYGSGKIVLYNFSDRPVIGKLVLPLSILSANSPTSVLKLLPGERREIEVAIQVPAENFQRIDAPVTFVPDDLAIPPARFVTSFMPDIAGMKAEIVASLLQSRAEGGRLKAEEFDRRLILNRKRATEEAPMTLAADGPNLVAFAQEGAVVTPTADGFSVTVTSPPPGKPQRVEVEIPWPDGLEFGANEFLSVEYRLR
jgi:hypothetical protein